MNAETTIEQPSNVPEIASAGESTPIKKQHGGKRPGSGRKPDPMKRMARKLRPASAIEILTEVDAAAMFRDVFKNGSRTQKLKAWAELQDRAYGRPAQSLNVAGGLTLAHWTPGCMAHLTDEDLDQLDYLTKKMLPPVSNAPQNAPGFQVESSAAIDAEVVESDAKDA